MLYDFMLKKLQKLK